MAELNVQKQELINYLKQTHPEFALYSDEEILSIYNEEISSLRLSEDEQISILGGAQGDFNHGLRLETQPLELTSDEESQLRSVLMARIETVTTKTSEAESKNGFLGKAWSWTKNNLLDWCTDSTNDIKKAQEDEKSALNGDIKEAFKKITGLDFTRENLDKFLNNEVPTKSEQALRGYAEGQEMAADFAGDMISGIAAVGIYTAAIAAAPFTGGASIALGLGLAAAGGGLIKSGIKAWDAHSAGREYDSFGKDMITGGFSGVLAPITGGFGGAVGRGVAAKLGVQALKHAGKEAVEVTGKQTLKTILSNPVGYEYAGKRAFLALGAEMATDGALGGSIDTTFRTAYEMNEKGEEITAGALFSSFIQGGLGGLFMAPAIGGGIKGMGKLGHFLSSNADAPETKLLGMVKEIDENEVWTPKSEAKPEVKPKAEDLSGLTRFKGYEIQEIFDEIDNPLLKEQDEAYVYELITRLGAMKMPGATHYYPRFEKFEISDMISQLNPKNKEIFETLINFKDKYGDYELSASDIIPLSEILGEIDYELAKKIINGFQNYLSPSRIKLIAKMVKTDPEAARLLSCDYDPEVIQLRLICDAVELDEIFHFVHHSTPEQKKFLDVLLPDGHVDTQIIKTVLASNVDINPKQLQTLLRNNSYNKALKRILKKMESCKSKELSSIDVSYVKAAPASYEENLAYITATGVSKEIAAEFCNHRLGSFLIHLMKFSDDLNLGLFGGIPNNKVVETMVPIFRTGNKDVLKEFDEMQPSMGYFTKENFEIFKKTTGKDNIEDFIESMESTICMMECKDACASITRQTGKKVYQNDLLIFGTDILKFSNMTDEEIASGIKALKELGLYQEDANFVTLLSRSRELADMNITPEIKDFASYLSSHSVEETALIDILHAVQGKNSGITQSKIAFVKEILKNPNLRQKDIVDVIQRVSSDNSQIAIKQLDTLYDVFQKDYNNLQVVSQFLNTDNIDEFNVYLKLFNQISSKKNGYAMLNSMIAPYNIPMKFELAKFASKLFEKNIETDKIATMICKLTGKHRDIAPEFISIYSKSLDTDLGPIRDFYEDIVLLQIGDDSAFNMKSRLNLYEKLNNLDADAKKIFTKIGLDYDELYEKVVNSLGKARPLVKISSKQSLLFIRNIIANNNPRAERVLREFDFSQFGKEGLPLKYTRAQFNDTVQNLLKDLNPDEVTIILKHFGLEPGAAGFDGLPNNVPFNNAKVSPEARNAAAKIQAEIERFTSQNEVMIADTETKEILDGLIKGLPEFTSVVGKQQHGTHAYSVDIHTLKVLQSAMNNPLYQSLTDLDKTVLKYSILLHDLGKKGGVIDQGHAGLSADYTNSILERYPFPAGLKDRIVDIVDNHHWFEKYNTGSCSAEDVAVRCRRPQDLKIYEIFSKADFENVNETFHLGSKSGGSKTQAEFDAYMAGKMKDIEDAVDKIYQNANLIFDTQFMHEGRNFPVKTIEIDGQPTELHVLNLSELEDGASLAEYGFAPNVTKENARFFVHMTNPNHTALETVFRLTRTPVFQSTWSTSMIKESNNRTYAYRQFGFIFDAPHSNISEAFFANTSSGTEKDLAAFKNFLFGTRSVTHNGKTYDVRHFVKDNFIEEMRARGYDLDATEYAALSQYLFNRKYTSQIRKDVQVGETVIKAQDLVEALEMSRDRLFDGGNIHSEIIPINPKVKGLIAKVERLEDCPPEFLKFAKEHNLPIILMKSTDH